MGLPGRLAEILATALLIAALVVIQVLVGGTRLVFSLPAYALLALMGVLVLFSLGRAKPNPDKLCLASAAIFFAYIVGRALFSPAEYLARPDIYSVLGGLLVYFFVACVLTGAKPRTIVLIFLLVAAMAQVVIGAIQFTEGNNFNPISFLGRPDYGRRASGFYACPNHLAGLVEVVGVFGLSVVCWSRWSTLGKLFVAYGTGVCYLGLVLTGSRGGYLSAIASLLVFAALSLTTLARSSQKLFLRIGVPFLVIAIAIGVAVSFSIRQSYYLSERASGLTGDDLADPSPAVRTSLWQTGLRQWTERPVFGTGSGTYLYYGRLFRPANVPGDPAHAHNDYVQLLAEYGAIGTAGFLLFLGFHLRRGWKNFERLGPKRIAASVSPSLLSNGLALNIGALSAAAAYIVHSIFDFNLHIPANVLLIAFVFGILANGGIPRGTEAHRPKLSFVLWRLALPAIGVVVAIQAVRLLPAEYFAERARTALVGGAPEIPIEFAQRGLTSEKKNPDLYRYLASAQTRKAYSSSEAEARALSHDATAALEKAYALAPRDATFVLALALDYDAAGRFNDAERMYQETLALDPKSKFLKQLYEAHLQKGDNRRNVDKEPQPKAESSPTNQP